MRSARAMVAVVLLGAAPALSAPKPILWARWEAHDPESAFRVDHAAWQAFLQEYVVADHPSGINRVRYADVGMADKGALEAYLERLQAVGVSQLNRAEQLAFWINLYNAATVKVILDHYPVQGIRDVDISPGWFADGPWGAKLMTVEDEEVSLDDIEHRILRPIWKDSRLHYAVNCASLGCPNLQPEAFAAASAERFLDKAAREYINHPRGARVEDGDLVLSKIYDWFAVDFGGAREGVIAHLGRHAGEPLREFLAGFGGAVRYEYDWSLNE